LSGLSTEESQAFTEHGPCLLPGVAHLRRPANAYRPATHPLSAIFPLNLPAFFPLMKRIHSDFRAAPEFHLFLVSLLPFYMIEKVISNLAEIPFIPRFDGLYRVSRG